MRLTTVVLSVVVLVASLLVVGNKATAIDPAAAELSLAFTQADKIKIDPTPAKVDLYAIPEDVQEFAVLKMNGEDGKNYVATNPTVAAFQGGEVGYRLVNDGLKVGTQPYGDRKYSI